jgi:hypothetical protein
MYPPNTAKMPPPRLPHTMQQVLVVEDSVVLTEVQKCRIASQRAWAVEKKRKLAEEKSQMK